MDAAAPRATLVNLAHAYGVATEYWDWQGAHVTVADATIRAVLGALGVEAADDEQVALSLEAVDERQWRRVLPATVVCREGWTPWVPVHVPHGSSVRVEVELEDGTTRVVPQVDHWVEPREVDGVLVGEATFELPGDLPLGWHRLHAHIGAAVVDRATETADAGSVAGSGHVATATLVVTPATLALPESLRDGRVWGLMEQVYQVRSERSWGIGDLSDLAELAAWAGEDLGADFVLVNPLHAAEPVSPMEPSPYLPTTRRFVNPVYLRVEEIPEAAGLTGAALRRAREAAESGRALNTDDTIDRDAVWAAKRTALEEVHGLGLTGRRARDFARYCRTEGEGLLTFATWCALAEEHGLPWTAWPAGLQDPASPEVAAFRETHRDRVDFHRWLQWLLDGQLAAVQRDAKAAGMSLGVVHDLAVGVNPHGADAWGLADALARGVTVGAPPDQFNQLGQDWDQPPWRPDRLAELGYAPYRDMLRTVLKDSGGIRVDHIIGLFRLWWVPQGHPASEGTYVRYDHEALVGILVLEAQRAGAVVVGEDLGVVEPWARDYMRERGVLGTSILWFEWDSEGRPLAPERYRELCLSTVTTHDLPPTAGYLGLEHVALRDRLGLLTRSVEEERAVELESIGNVKALLRGRGLIGDDAGVPEVVEGLHRLLAQTPSRMLGVAVTDLVGDIRSINQPGTQDEYPNWRLPLAGPDGRPVGLEQVMASPAALRLAGAVGRLIPAE
ncbi:4-alpha-glucanotransferase [Phycicoccus sp. SLBN-51]|uniref:4-alpha-glucanotransferase n=1 Tax=Phycicoccus sp. SLBN-51 TaxID=2768447 RepID=UPI001150CF6D|nr:4-alpha-glucanotransferase [Phycicoccus sp. SLBN-51]TQJ48937.1 4-alpha-glucanotransferase [Phycicoccus sp. SLBN-51]